MKMQDPIRWSGAAPLLLVLLIVTSPFAGAEEDLAELEERAMMAAVAKVAPSVVRIETFGGLERVQGMLAGDRPTTGLVVAQEGFIISSAFNFVQKPSSILVTLPGGRRAAAKIVARDHSRMLVLLKVEAPDPLAVPEPVPMDEMSVGQWTIAVGRTYDRSVPSMSVGMLSAKNRIWNKAVQTDAKVSPANYGGPLVDLRGRVLGVLVPLSPDSQHEIAGAEWYDSGIGFAIPLSDINKHLDRLKNGEDLYPGLLGITLKGDNIYALPAEIAACQVKSPAYNAGLRAADTIVELDGVRIERQVQLKHALGARYAGDKLRVVALRGNERIETVVELTDKLLPYEHPFLGILPMRDGSADEGGVVVRHVYPASGAAEAGILPGDRLLSLNGNPANDADSLRVAVANLQPNEKALVGVDRRGEVLNLEIALGTLPTEIPGELPPARRSVKAEGQEGTGKGAVEIKLPEEPNECVAYVPDTYVPDVAHGLVVCLDPPGSFDRDKFVARWRPDCQRNDLIVLAPRPRDATRWNAVETEFIRKTVDHAIGQYHIDRTRIVVFGRQAGGAMALLVAFRHRELVRGVATVDAPLPVGTRPPNNDPIQRLAIYTALAEESELAERVKAGVQLLQSMKYPVTVKSLDEPRDLNGQELSELARWIDTLDRI